jgi:hypothetical protein
LSVLIFDTRTGLALGEAGKILATHDGGEHWEPQSSGTEYHLWGMCFADAWTGWAVGDAGIVLVTRDGGEHWRRQIEHLDLFPLRGVSFVDARTGWIVGGGWRD